MVVIGFHSVGHWSFIHFVWNYWNQVDQNRSNTPAPALDKRPVNQGSRSNKSQIHSNTGYLCMKKYGVNDKLCVLLMFWYIYSSLSSFREESVSLLYKYDVSSLFSSESYSVLEPSITPEPSLTHWYSNLLVYYKKVRDLGNCLFTENRLPSSHTEDLWFLKRVSGKVLQNLPRDGEWETVGREGSHKRLPVIWDASAHDTSRTHSFGRQQRHLRHRCLSNPYVNKDLHDR